MSATVHQLSLFLENRPGQMIEPCQLLAEAGIDIRAMTLVDTERFGILRMIVSDWRQGEKILKEAGFVVTATEVLAVEVSLKSSDFIRALQLLAGNDISIEYLYAFATSRDQPAIIVFRVSDTAGAVKVLSEAGIRMLAEADLV